MADDYVPGDEFDWDQSDDSQYCPHGTFIGSWWGPDILCGYCEDGISDADYRAILARQHHDVLADRARNEVYNFITGILPSRRDSIKANPGAASSWIADLLTDIKESDSDTLEAFLS